MMSENSLQRDLLFPYLPLLSNGKSHECGGIPGQIILAAGLASGGPGIFLL